MKTPTFKWLDIKNIDDLIDWPQLRSWIKTGYHTDINKSINDRPIEGSRKRKISPEENLTNGE